MTYKGFFAKHYLFTGIFYRANLMFLFVKICSLLQNEFIKINVWDNILSLSDIMIRQSQPYF